MPREREFHSSQEMYELAECEVLNETGSAALIATRANPDGVWIPFSQINKITKRFPADRYTSSVRMTAWIAKKKGLR